MSDVVTSAVASNEMATYLFTSKYARYIENEHRRETWKEMVNRSLQMHLEKYSFLSDEYKEEIKKAFKLMEEKKILSSMRSSQFAGKAVFQNNERLYNCSVRHIDSLRSFAESFHLLLSGCGVGFGLSDRFLSRLPDLVGINDKTGIVINYVIEDTIEGWSNSLEALMSCYFKNNPYTGRKIVFDFSRIRKKGELLKTSGGKAPGYKPLKKALEKVKYILDNIVEIKNQTRLKSINAYDILMHCADAVLSGGIRRSACSIIFMPEDEAMLNAKIDFDVIKKGRFEHNKKTDRYEGYVVINDFVYNGDKKIEVTLTKLELQYLYKQKKISWFHIHPQRGRSNNSILLIRDETTLEDFIKVLIRTRNYGEPAFVFANRRDVLFNPCFEISFIPIDSDGQCGVQMCNLTSINGSKVYTEEDFYEFCEAISLIGTLQAGYTDLKFLNPVSKKLTEEEALLGCSITGIMTNKKILLNPSALKKGANICVETNKKWAKLIGINPASRVTCVKPEGSGTLVLAEGNSIPSSGCHPHHARRFFRRVQANKIDPIYRYFKKHNPEMCEESVYSANNTDDVITFPIEVPESYMIKDDLTAIEHLEYVKLLQKNWVEEGTNREKNTRDVHHNVSVTVEVSENEWDEVTEYLYKNRKYFSAVSFVPKNVDKIYKQSPLERVVTEEDIKKFDSLRKSLKSVDYTKLAEAEDNTSMMSEVVCAGGYCELV